MNQDNIALDKSVPGHSAKKFTCPKCGQKRFVCYYNFTKGEYLSNEYGRCDRQDSCQYHCKPYGELGKSPQSSMRRIIEPLKPPSYVDSTIFNQSRGKFEQNRLVQFLLTVFDEPDVSKVIDEYRVGTSNHRYKRADHPGYISNKGATVFWQVDKRGNVRGGKVILYDSTTGNRVRLPFAHIIAAQKLLNLKDFNLRQCLFGEHLINDYPKKPIAIVESEKTAIVCSLYYPNYLWLACGGKDQLNSEKIVPLFGRPITLFPDLKSYDDWVEKAAELSYIADISVSDSLEIIATAEEKDQGLDLADYCLRMPYKRFRLRNALKNELISNNYTASKQIAIAQRYIALGLLPIDVKSVAEELIKEHGFVAA